MQLICIPEAAALLSTRDKSPALKMCRVCISRLAVYWWHKQPYQVGACGLYPVCTFVLCSFPPTAVLFNFHRLLLSFTLSSEALETLLGSWFGVRK